MKRAIALISTNYAIPPMRELTNERPVAAIPFGGRYRILDFSLSSIVNCGIRTVGLITSNFYRPILDHLGAGKEWNLDRKKGGMFILPGSSYGLRSTGGRFMLRDLLKNEEYLTKDDIDEIIVTASNDVVNMDYGEVLKEHRKAAPKSPSSSSPIAISPSDRGQCSSCKWTRRQWRASVQEELPAEPFCSYRQLHHPAGNPCFA